MYAFEYVWNPDTGNLDLKAYRVVDCKPDKEATTITARCVCGNVLVSGRKECRTCEEGGFDG